MRIKGTALEWHLQNAGETLSAREVAVKPPGPKRCNVPLMNLRTKIISIAIAATAVIGGGTAYAATSAGEPPAPVVSNDQANNTSIFACYNGGKFSYAEWRLPMPHTCWYPGDVLVQLPAQKITFLVDVPKAITGGTADLKLTETCLTDQSPLTGDAQAPTYICTVGP